MLSINDVLGFATPQMPRHRLHEYNRFGNEIPFHSEIFRHLKNISGETLNSSFTLLKFHRSGKSRRKSLLLLFRKVRRITLVRNAVLYASTFAMQKPDPIFGRTREHFEILCCFPIHRDSSSQPYCRSSSQVQSSYLEGC
jgi:hypothetical protein